MSTTIPKIALGAWLTADEISRLERFGDETGVHTLREWEKEM